MEKSFLIPLSVGLTSSPERKWVKEQGYGSLPSGEQHHPKSNMLHWTARVIEDNISE